MSKHAHEFSGVFYASNDDTDDILHRLADIVCPTGGVVISKPIHEQDMEIGGSTHDDD